MILNFPNHYIIQPNKGHNLNRNPDYTLSRLFLKKIQTIIKLDMKKIKIKISSNQELISSIILIINKKSITFILSFYLIKSVSLHRGHLSTISSLPTQPQFLQR